MFDYPNRFTSEERSYDTFFFYQLATLVFAPGVPNFYKSIVRGTCDKFMWINLVRYTSGYAAMCVIPFAPYLLM